MAMVVPNVMLQVLLDEWDGYLADAVIRLFKNDLPVNGGVMIGDVVEADFDGYEPFDLGPAPPAAFAIDRARKTWPVVEWEATGAPQTVYGYYVTDADNAALLWIERYSPVGGVTVGAGIAYRVTPRLDLKRIEV